MVAPWPFVNYGSLLADAGNSDAAHLATGDNRWLSQRLPVLGQRV